MKTRTGWKLKSTMEWWGWQEGGLERELFVAFGGSAREEEEEGKEEEERRRSRGAPVQLSLHGSK